MKAGRELRVVHTAGSGPPGRGLLGLLRATPSSSEPEVVEVIHIATGETVFLWDLEPLEARRWLKALRRELAEFETDDFLARWSAVEGPQDV